jgi:hypothetical protein
MIVFAGVEQRRKPGATLLPAASIVPSSYCQSR